MTLSQELFLRKLQEAKQRVKDFLADDKLNRDNTKRRILYCEVDGLRLDLEEISEQNESVNNDSWPSAQDVEDLNKEINDILKSLPLVAIKRTMKDNFLFYNPIFIFIETYIRFIGVACSIFFAGAFLSIPILILRVIDIQLRRDPYEYLSESLKKVVTTTVLYQAGLEVTVLGLTPDLLASTNCFIMAFTHACNIDGFLVAGSLINAVLE